MTIKAGDGGSADEAAQGEEAEGQGGEAQEAGGGDRLLGGGWVGLGQKLFAVKVYIEISDQGRSRQ